MKELIGGFFMEYDFSHENDSVNHIYDHIYLGSCKSALITTTSRPDIKYILNLSGYTLHAPNKHILELKIEDSPDCQIKDLFEKAHEFIERAKINNSGVLVHCRAGISRSPTIVISYLMKIYCMTFDYAFNLVKTKRSIINPNERFLDTLKAYC